MIIPTVGAVRWGGGAATSDRAEVTLFGAGRVGTSVFRLPMVKGADGTDWVIILADRSGMPIPLTVAAAGGCIGGVGDFNLSFTGEEENVGAHLLSFLRGGSNHHRGGIFEGPGVGVRVEEASRGDRKTLSIEDSRFEVNE